MNKGARVKIERIEGQSQKGLRVKFKKGSRVKQKWFEGHI